jgi:hypothetical protein
MKTTLKGFLTNRDETGRFIVRSLRTGKVYFVEPIEHSRPASWGDVDPAAKKVCGAYGQKYRGAVSPAESVLTEANGFVQIVSVQGSPFWEIEQRDKRYLESMKN